MSDNVGEYGTIHIVLRKTRTLGAALPLDRCEDDIPDATAERTIGRWVPRHSVPRASLMHVQPP